MKRPMCRADDTIIRLRQQINLEEDSGKLKELVARLQIALSEPPREMPADVKADGRREGNPFDLVLL